MNSIAEIFNRVKQGDDLETIIPEGADLSWWRRALANYKPGQKRRPARRKSGSRNRKRTNYASQVVARNKAAAELVRRVNEPESRTMFVNGELRVWR